MITKAAWIPPSLRTLLSIPRRVAILAGSGISIASGLPSGMEFNAQLISALSRNLSSRRDLAHCLITKDQTTGVRFEQIIECLSVCTPDWTDVFDIFDGLVFPNELHRWAATALAKGSAVFTTNFDSLIEAAFGSLRAQGARPLRAVFEEGVSGSAETSFDDCLRSPYTPCLYKLHGSIRRLVATNSNELTLKATDRSSIRAILTRIGDRTARFGLPPASSAVFTNQLRNRLLLVLGYSGLDDFDVLPTLSAHAGDLKGVIWIAHRNQPAALSRSNLSIPKALRLALKRASVPMFVIKGCTHEIVQLPKMDLPNQLRTTSKPIKDIFPWLCQIDRPERELLIGMIFEAANDPRHALISYQNAVQLSLRGRSYGLLSIARRRVANVLASQSEYRKAFAAIKVSIKADRSRDQNALADDYSLASDIYWRRGRYDVALKFATDAYRIHRRLPSAEGAANDLTRMANVHWMKGALNDAARLERAAIRTNRRLNRKLEVARGLITLGSILRSKARYDEALTALQEAKDLHSTLRDEIGLASTLNNLGSVYLDMGDLTTARRYYVQARDLNEKLGVSDHMATNIGNIGIVCRKRGQYSKALAYYQHALRINTEIGAVVGQIRDMGNIGVAYIELNRLDRAEEWLKRSLRLSRRLGRAENEAVQLQNLGIVARMRGRYQKATSLFNQALAINRSLGRPLGISDMLQERGRVYMAEGWYSNARLMFMRAYHIAEARRIREGVAVIARDLARVFEAEGNKKQAGRFGYISLRAFKRLQRAKDVQQLHRFLKALA